MAGLPILPDDIYVSIFQLIGLADLLILRRVCKQFKEITHLRSLWISLLQTEIWDRHIPTPGLTIDSLDNQTSPQLEQYVHKSLLLHRNWTSSEPIATTRRHITVADAHIPQTRIISLHFLRIHGHSCLLSFSLTHRADPRVINLECWDLSSSSSDPPKCIARRSIRWFGGYAVNSDHSKPGLVAIRTPHVEILGIDLDATSVETGFITLMTLPTDAKAILAFTGTTIAFKNLDGAVKLLDTTRPLCEVKLGYPQPDLPVNQPDSFEAVIQHDYAVILRPKTLELYPLTRFRKGEDGLNSLAPAVVHQFQFRIDSCRMELQLFPHLFNSPGTSTASNPPIHILIRYSSLFPWPVNLIHHYTLFPNPSYDLIPLGSGLDVVNASNLPYHITPVLLHTISSPVRLFSITDMTLGRYGTALWLDSHTEDHFYQGERGQRLAGRKLTVPKDVNTESLENLESQDYNTEAAASMIFGFNENDDWNRITLDDKEGWIAIGSTNGQIIVDDYI